MHFYLCKSLRIPSSHPECCCSSCAQVCALAACCRRSPSSVQRSFRVCSPITHRSYWKSERFKDCKNYSCRISTYIYITCRRLIIHNYVHRMNIVFPRNEMSHFQCLKIQVTVGYMSLFWRFIFGNMANTSHSHLFILWY